MAQPIELIDVDAFWRRVESRNIDECWLWTRRFDRYGYGEYQRNVQGHKMSWIAHRVAYRLLVGPIPDGLTLDHLCRNRACVNPAHLEPVTNAVNLRRGSAARQAMPTTDGWLYCVDQYAAGRSMSDIANELGLHRGTISYRLKQSGIDVRPRGRPPKAA